MSPPEEEQKMVKWVAFTFHKLSQQLQKHSGTIAILSLGLGLFLAWNAIARRCVPPRRDTGVEGTVGDAVGDAEDITYQTISVFTLSGLRRCQALLDAGSLHNWISLELALEMDLPIQPVSEQEISSISAIDASGNDVVPSGKVAATWLWEGSNNPKTAKFYVGIRVAFMIIGSNYLFPEKIFTFNKKFVLPLKAKRKKEDKARDEAAHAAQNAKSEVDMAEKDAQRRREYEEFQRKNAGDPSAQGSNVQGGSGSSGTVP